jgi:hypothetical protein
MAHVVQFFSPITLRSPAFTYNVSLFWEGGKGHVAKGVKAQGGLMDLLKSRMTAPSGPGFDAYRNLPDG